MMTDYHILFDFNHQTAAFIVATDKPLPSRIANMASIILVNPPQGIFKKDRYGLAGAHFVQHRHTIEEALAYIEKVLAK